MAEPSGALALAIALLADLTLALGGGALRNSHVPRLEEMRAQGKTGAGLAAHLASEATRLIVSVRLSQTVLRLIVVGLSLRVLTPILGMGDIPAGWIIPGLLVASGAVLFLLEFTCENLALRAPELWASRLAPFIAVVIAVSSPAGSLVLRYGGRLAGSRGGRKHLLVTEEEIMTLVDAGEEGGVIEEEEKEMIYSIFQLGDTLAREVMVPRIDIVAFEERTALAEATNTMVAAGHSRAPVYRGTIDNIIGMISAKDLLAAWRDGRQDQAVGQITRAVHFVPEAVRVRDLLADLQARRIQLAVVVDEYGGTAGIVSIEDIVEEIVGEIRDEYDAAEEPSVQPLPDGGYLVSGRIDLDDLNESLGADLPKDQSDTLGGFIYGHLGRVPTPGEEVQAGGLRLVVEQVSGRRIRKVRVTHLAETAGAGKSNGDSGSARS
ncbi:MAG: hemolysin family protein [Anaerolineales bacterium]